MKKMTRVALITSGGDCQGLNAAIRGVGKALYNKIENLEIFGMYDGYRGLIDGDYKFMESRDFCGILTEGGTMLGTSRQKYIPGKDIVDEDGNSLLPAMKDTYNRLNLDCLVIMGGNGTQKSAKLLMDAGMNVITLPKTIDNDLVETDHTPGYESAAKYVATVVREISADATVYDNKQSVTIVEIMGRHAGWLTAASILARKFEGDNPVLIYVPEVAFDQEAFIAKVTESLKHTPNLVVCISEGIHDKDGTFICEYSSEVGTDTFGHKMLTGSGKYLENLVKERLGVKVRSIELNVCQRCSCAHLSRVDLDESENAGIFAVLSALAGETGKMINFIRNKSVPYELSYGTADVNIICNQEKTVPLEWIIADGSDISNEFIDYVRPLTQGFVELPTKNGIPLFAYRK